MHLTQTVGLFGLSKYVGKTRQDATGVMVCPDRGAGEKCVTAGKKSNRVFVMADRQSQRPTAIKADTKGLMTAVNVFNHRPKQRSFLIVTGLTGLLSLRKKVCNGR